MSPVQSGDGPNVAHVGPEIYFVLFDHENCCLSYRQHTYPTLSFPSLESLKNSSMVTLWLP